MYHDTELGDLMRLIAEKSLKMMKELEQNTSVLPALIQHFIDLTADFQQLLNNILKHPEKIWHMQLAYWQDALTLTQEQLNYWIDGHSMPINDKRFNSDEWVNNPFFNLLSQHYLLASKHINALLNRVELDDQKVIERLRFFTRQYLDALSPANFLYTNPQVISETIQSHGKNLLRGLNNLLTDLETKSPHLSIRMTDTSAFKVGKNLAVTKGFVIFRNDMMELIQYLPVTEKVHAIPLLIIPPWINKYYILDLSHDNSLIGWLVAQGFSVFVISWVNPDKTYVTKDMFDYLQSGPITAIDIIKKQLNIKKVNTLGFCIGGTLLACLLAYVKAQGDNTNPIKSATFLASMIDFSDPGDIAVFIDEHQIKRLEEQMQSTGYLDGHFMANTFNSLRANELVWSFFIRNYLQGKDAVPFDILYWNSDATNMPAAMHSQYLRWMYLHNELIIPNKIHLNNTPLDISKIDTPTFFVSTQKDHIAPWKTVYQGFQKVTGRKEFLLGGSGHIAGIINPPYQKKYYYFHNPTTTDPADDWLKNATKRTGSWWPYWRSWLKKQSGQLIKAYDDFSSLPYPALMKAPGGYVLKTYSAKISTATIEKPSL